MFVCVHLCVRLCVSVRVCACVCMESSRASSSLCSSCASIRADDFHPRTIRSMHGCKIHIQFTPIAAEPGSQPCRVDRGGTANRTTKGLKPTSTLASHSIFSNGLWRLFDVMGIQWRGSPVGGCLVAVLCGVLLLGELRVYCDVWSVCARCGGCAGCGGCSWAVL
jgi:hypothetical protein